MTAATLYVVPGSHSSMTGRLMLEHKQIKYRRIDLLPAIHKPLLRMLGFAHTTVPALRIDDRRIQNTTVISRTLEHLRPEPPLFPTDPAQRSAVEEAETWGEAVLQPLPRRLSWWAFGRDRSGLRSFAEDARLGVPLGLAIHAAAPIIAIERRLNTATDATVRADMSALPAMLDHIDELIAAGTLGSRLPNAADYQIATSVRLFMCFDDLRAAIERRPAGAYARRVVPRFPGSIGRVIPANWLRVR
jgi:glutathione S-transferase